ncbi:MAG: exonuclease sbcCD subunit D, partial [Flammeovirgaceae bacterium]|nr:exonuclease sbcCD subunit D [Flammeovirgaceae bacterium]MDW8287819.1 exonuclease sbcCD subunit D [Flammeovirgaceae bacterium]
AIAGNHDSPERIEAPVPLAKACGIVLVGFPYTIPTPFSLSGGFELTKVDRGFLELTLPTIPFPLRILLTPYANEMRLKEYLGNNDAIALNETLARHWRSLSDKYCDEKGVNILLAHLLMTSDENAIPQEPEDEKSINYIGGASAVLTSSIPPQIQYTALGHLHRKQILAENAAPVAYSGSILEYSFSEAHQQKYVIVIEAVPQKPVDLTFIPLQKGFKLKRATFDDEQKAIEWLQKNRESFIELTFRTETYLEATLKKRFLEANPRIVHLIPSLMQKDTEKSSSEKSIDPQKHIHELFIEYFKHKKNQEPNTELMQLFQEIINFDA